MPARVLFIGFDSLDKDLLLEWARRGDLPTFGALLKTSAYADTKNPPGLYGGALRY